MSETVVQLNQISGVLCPNCEAAILTVCNQQMQGAFQLPNGEWVFCQLCSALDGVEEIRGELEIIKISLWDYQKKNGGFYVKEICDLLGHKYDCEMMNNFYSSCTCGGVK